MRMGIIIEIIKVIVYSIIMGIMGIMGTIIIICLMICTVLLKNRKICTVLS